MAGSKVFAQSSQTKEPTLKATAKTAWETALQDNGVPMAPITLGNGKTTCAMAKASSP